MASVELNVARIANAVGQANDKARMRETFQVLICSDRSATEHAAQCREDVGTGFSLALDASPAVRFVRSVLLWTGLLLDEFFYVE